MLGLPSKTMPEQKQEDKHNPNLEQFTARDLQILAPFRIEKWEPVEKQATTKDGRTFTSTSYVLTITPQANESLKAQVTVFARDFNELKAIAFMNGGFNNTWFKVTRDDSRPRTPNIYSGFKAK